MAHIVAFPIDLINGLAGDSVLVLVLPPQLVDDLQLVLQIPLHQQGKLGDQDEHAAQNQQNGIADHIGAVVKSHPPQAHVIAQHHLRQHRPHHQGQQGAPVQVHILAPLQLPPKAQVDQWQHRRRDGKLEQEILRRGQAADSEPQLAAKGNDKLDAVPRHGAEQGFLPTHLKAGQRKRHNHQHGPAKDKQVFHIAVGQGVIDYRHAHHPEGKGRGHGRAPPAAALLAPEKHQGRASQGNVKAQGVEHRHAERHAHVRSSLPDSCSALPALRPAWGG